MFFGIGKRLWLQLFHLVLLVSVGILPDKSSEALKCYECGDPPLPPQPGVPSCVGQVKEADCASSGKYCVTISFKGSGNLIRKSCSEKITEALPQLPIPGMGFDTFFDDFGACALKDHGGCIDSKDPFGTEPKAAFEDLKERYKGTCVEEICDQILPLVHIFARTAQEGSKGRQFGDELMTYCFCDKDLCNGAKPKPTVTVAQTVAPTEDGGNTGENGSGKVTCQLCTFLCFIGGYLLGRYNS